jgi:aldehyde:ferredoxin oxidoreductase
MTWQEIFAQTDRDINLQRVMNIMVYGKETGRQDRIPDRAVGPTDDALYDAEQEDNDRELVRFLEKPLAEVQGMTPAEKREILMSRRKERLRELIQAYYRVRGWNEEGVPTPETLKQIGLWEFLNGEARARILEMTA